MASSSDHDEGAAVAARVERRWAILSAVIVVLLIAMAVFAGIHRATRGGLATVLNEIALDGGVAIEVEETAIPVMDGVAGACELLGLDPLYVACEGRMVLFIPEPEADRALGILRAHPLAANASRIGRVNEGPKGMVTLKTRLGGRRLLDLLTGEQLPRIC